MFSMLNNWCVLSTGRCVRICRSDSFSGAMPQIPEPVFMEEVPGIEYVVIRCTLVVQHDVVGSRNPHDVVDASCRK